MLGALESPTGAWRWVPEGIRGALVLSILLHLFLIGTVELGARLGWWRHSFIQNWLVTPVNARQAAALAEARAQAELRKLEEIPLVFLEVDPSQASADAPEQAAYYAAANSRAANPDTADTLKPRIDGNQDKVPRTTTLQYPTVQPVQPIQSVPEPLPLVALAPRPRERPAPRVESQAKSETALKPGDLLVAKPAPDSQNIASTGQSRAGTQPLPRPERPRTVAQARAQQGQSAITGEKMKQEGGVKRFGVESTLDARATSYGAYDAAVIAAIQQRWYTLLDERSYSLERSGKVVIKFRMKYDGSIQNLEVVDADVGELLSIVCAKAIDDPAPFGAWPRQMRVELGDFRDVRFTFHYN